MESVSLSSKGQLVLPKAIRDRHNWETGTRLIVIDRGDEVVLKAVTPFASSVFESADAESAYKGKALSLEEMDQAVAQEAGKQR
jgi:AbrB family looped-hinge helix DNA binding protein